MERTFSDEVWKTGVPQKNGWRKLDFNTNVIASKLPEQKEIKSKRSVETVEVPPMPEIPADEEQDIVDDLLDEPVKAKTKIKKK